MANLRSCALSASLFLLTADLIQPGVLRAEKLVYLARHDYSLEPNVTFTPDMKWIVFRSNMFGPTHVFAVEVNKQ
jgi:oligogalacturonide lyase